jgi:hypothetical protein
MPSKAETFVSYAAQCDRMASAVADSRLKALYADLAFQWRELATTTRLLEAERRGREQFFHGGSQA